MSLCTRASTCIVLFLAHCAAPLRAADPVRTALTNRAERPAAPHITAKEETGQPLNLKPYTGKVMLVDFWATWCGGCKQELPWFQEFQAKYGPQDFTVVAVSMDEEGWKIIKPFVETIKLNLKVVLDDGDTSKRFALTQMPAAFLIDRDGRVAAKYVGMADRENMDANIRALLAEQKSKP